MSNEDNLEFWNSVEKTDPEHTKKVTAGGRSLTAINAQQQIKNATSKWGMYGRAWGLKDIKLDYVKDLTNNQILAVAQCVFYYPKGEFEIGSSILVQSWVLSKTYNKVDDDFLKKLETDMTTKSLSKLGFNADVFLGYYDDNKYVTKMIEEFKEPEPLLKWDDKGSKNALEKGKTIEEVKKFYSLNKEQEEAYEAALAFEQSGATESDIY